MFIFISITSINLLFKANLNLIIILNTKKKWVGIKKKIKLCGLIRTYHQVFPGEDWSCRLKLVPQ
jgi:hypothetical protein